MALLDHTIPFYDPKENNLAFSEIFQERDQIVDPVYANATVFEIADPRQSDQLMRDMMARDAFNYRKEVQVE